MRDPADKVNSQPKNTPLRALTNVERQQLFNKLRQHVNKPKNIVSSGNDALDAQLGGGWPQGCLIEILGGNHLQPLLPLLKAVSDSQRYIAWVKPPFIPYPPALAQQGIPAAMQLILEPKKPADTFWSMEQLLRTASCGAVLGWQEPYTPHTLRRLQLAAEAGDSIALLFRPGSSQQQPSAASVRLLLEQNNGQLLGKLLKVRGRLTGETIQFAYAENNYHG